MSQFEQFWAAGDDVIHAVFWVLLAMSVISWTLIFWKSWQLSSHRLKAGAAMQAFWQANNWQAGVAALASLPAYSLLAQAGDKGMQWVVSEQKKSHTQLADNLPASELMVQSLRGGLSQANNQLETGQTMLASIGSTAPFVGLFGTVWGIYHALMTISGTQQVALDQISGPVGEALIMTALGLFLAIPAVLAYNAFNRQIRLVASDLDGFAHDLHLYFVSQQRKG
ncbi:MAG TPA: MotA/TolQ/ExbB proton channel family protein [Thiotrichales bacterium]|nr:MotA/TolQ/ExbB proton channel family protein [Thiotrichales bacterium]